MPASACGSADRDRRRGVVHPAGVSDRLGHVAADLVQTAGVAVELEGFLSGRLPPTAPTLFPYTTLFRSVDAQVVGATCVGGQRRRGWHDVEAFGRQIG